MEPLILRRAGAGESLQASALAERIGPCLSAEADRSLLIYLHIPFCSSKCTFCDWVTDIPVRQLRSGPSLRHEYAEALCRQIRAVGPELTSLGYVPRHIYWGGGTPSRLDEPEFALVGEALAEAFDLTAIEEHTLESSPETLTEEKLAAMRRLGVNRISMGIQSFDESELRRAGRAHSAAQAESAVRMIHAAGVPNINLDLIVGFPEQTRDMLARTLDKTLALDPRHVTIYVYRATRGTVMATQIGSGHRDANPLTDLLAAYELARRTLEEAGYAEYAVGYFMKGDAARFKGEEYYFALEGDYIGFGSGAESILGHHNLKNPPAGLHEFIEAPTGFATCERYSPARVESTFAALRLTMLTEDGIDFRRFERLFGFPFATVRQRPAVKALIEYLRFCGTEFIETPERLVVSEGSRRRAYIVSLDRAFTPTRAAHA